MTLSHIIMLMMGYLFGSLMQRKFHSHQWTNWTDIEADDSIPCQYRECTACNLKQARAVKIFW